VRVAALMRGYEMHKKMYSSRLKGIRDVVYLAVGRRLILKWLFFFKKGSKGADRR
jgi:hypothetical protein